MRRPDVVVMWLDVDVSRSSGQRLELVGWRYVSVGRKIQSTERARRHSARPLPPPTHPNAPLPPTSATRSPPHAPYTFASGSSPPRHAPFSISSGLPTALALRLSCGLSGRVVARRVTGG